VLRNAWIVYEGEQITEETYPTHCVQHTVTRDEKWSSSEPHTNCGRCRCRL